MRDQGIVMSTIVVSDFNADIFARIVGNAVEEAGKTSAAAYGQVFQNLIGISSEQMGGGADPLQNLIVWTRPEAMFPTFRKAILHEKFSLSELLSEVDEFISAIKAAAKAVPNLFVMSMYSEAGNYSHGMLNYRPGTGIKYLVDKINTLIAEGLEDCKGVFLLDSAPYFRGMTAPMSPKLYYTAKVPYSIQVFKRAADDIRSCLQGLKGKARRVLVLDLDNTVWGGILGDEGLKGIAIGGHDHVGEAFAEFQRAVKALANRGVALALASKNYEENALNVFKNHPEMILKMEDISAWRINWTDKAQNIIEMAKELNLGLASFVFIDDNPAERARVSEALPEVLVPDWPLDPAEYVSALNALSCFNVPVISSEDAQRTKMFAAERERKTLQATLSHEDWLKSISMSVVIEPLAENNIARISQLINKSNQFNARNRRVSEVELADWKASTGAEVWGFRVSDKYGDSGLTGVISAEVRDGVCHVSDFVMSCRVMGRGVERLMLCAVVEFAQSKGAGRVVCEFLPTERNQPMRDFLDQSGMEKHGDIYTWDSERNYSRPSHINVEK
ncbi:FkbH domain [Bordetella trematum]|nr:FkbH domain [Bordetella trematum]VDH08807.1 FkbH domain [Bordetella trematum]